MSETETRTRPGGTPDFRDAEGFVTSEYVQLVTGAVLAADAAALRVLTEPLHDVDVGDLIEALDADDRARFVTLLGRDFDFTALTEVDDGVREDILEELPNEAIAEGVAALESDDAVYIIEDLAPEDQVEVLARLPATERVSLERSLEYPEGSAGRLMQADFIAVPPFWTVEGALTHCRESAEEHGRFFEICVVDPAMTLMGTLPLDRLVRAVPSARMDEVMLPVSHRIHASDPAHETAKLFRDYNLVSAPVLDAGDRLVGMLTVDDIVDVITDEADSDIKALGGVKADEELSDSVLVTARSRFTWLLANLVTAVVASLVIGMFEASLEQMVALAVLMPIVASMGGNAGTQTMTVAVRALALQVLGRANAWRIVRREAAVGLLNGIAFALIMGTVAALWFRVPDLFVVMGLAMVCVLVAGAPGGIVIPMLLNRANIDPAVSSGPFVTTVTDVVGFFSFLGIATLWFGLR